jgi:formate-dependent nitrite reductase membrane component NrfD
MSPIEKAKGAYFFILLIVLLCLYILNLLNVANNPAYMATPGALTKGTAQSFFIILIITGILFALYGIFYLVTLIRNFIYFC